MIETIYAINYRSYDSHEIISIHRTKERAEEKLNLELLDMDESQHDNYSIDEYDLED